MNEIPVRPAASWLSPAPQQTAAFRRLTPKPQPSVRATLSAKEPVSRKFWNRRPHRSVTSAGDDNGVSKAETQVFSARHRFVNTKAMTLLEPLCHTGGSIAHPKGRITRQWGHLASWP